jgi:hypothetical protein
MAFSSQKTGNHLFFETICKNWRGFLQLLRGKMRHSLRSGATIAQREIDNLRFFEIN